MTGNAIILNIRRSRMALTTEERLLVNSEVQKRGKNILLAYILLIFLGTLGIHRFYLGKTGSAVAQLVLTIVGWMTVVLIIGFIPLVVVGIRSEEHTSELQSRGHLVCRLLLVKKNTAHKRTTSRL